MRRGKDAADLAGIESRAGTRRDRYRRMSAVRRFDSGFLDMLVQLFFSNPVLLYSSTSGRPPGRTSFGERGRKSDGDP
jgi:hypothetical protein